MIYNKSTHPIEVKKISIRMWSLRDEIETAIERRMKECEAAGVPLYIDDIKKYYNLNVNAPLVEQSNVLEMHPADDNVTALMESVAEVSGADETLASEEKPLPESTPEAQEAQDSQTPEGAEAGAPGGGENTTFKEADKTIAEQTLQGLETKKPNLILERPFERMPPDLAKISYGFSLLADINMDGILCFTKNNFLQGQSVVMEFLIPQNFMMHADIIYCNHYARTSKIISSTKLDYRVQGRFTFRLSGERDSLRRFLISVQPDIPLPPKKASKEASEEDSLGL